MNEIKKLYKLQKELHPELGDYINLCFVIRGRNYQKINIRNAFLKLVDREQYDWAERKELIDYLFEVTQKGINSKN